MKIAVLGGGISGLAAAQRLVRAGAEVQLFEAASRLGGVLETLRVGEYLIERSADNFATLIPDALELSRECGCAEQLVRPNENGRQAFVWSSRGVVSIPAGFSLMQPTRFASILATPALSLGGKLRLLGEFWVPKRPPAGDDDDESLESFAVRRLGREAFESLVEPIVSGIFTADPKTLSMRATMPQFVEMEQRSGGLIRGYLASKREDAAAAARRASGARYDQFMAPRDGMNSWIAAIAEQLPAESLRTSCRVEVVRPTGVQGANGWRLEYRGPDGNLQIDEFAGVVCALPAANTANLLEGWANTASMLVRQIEYASSVVYAVIINRRDLSARQDGFGMIVPGKFGRDAMAISYTSNKYPNRVPADEILLRVFLGGAMRPEVIDLPDAQIEHMAVRELRELLGWTGSEPNWSGIIRWRNAMPQYKVGHVSRLKLLKQALDPFQTFQLCGAAYEGVGIPQCVRAARKASDRLLDELRQSNLALSARL